MSRSLRYFLSCVLAAICWWAGGVPARAQTEPPPETRRETPRTIHFPAAMTPWETKTAFGFTTIAVPSAIAQEGSVLRWPLFGFGIVVGLPHNFLLEGVVSTEIVTNHFELDGRWVVNVTDALHASAGLGAAYWFGQLEQFGFNNNIHGWFTYPSVRVGYDFGSLALSAEGKLSIVNSLYLRTGELETSKGTNQFNGFSYRVSLEQPFWKTTNIGIAFQMNYLKFYYPEWPLFPAFDYYFWIPEAQIWLSL